MARTVLRMLTVFAVASSPLLIAQCGGGSSSSPSAPAAPAAPGGGTPAPAPAPAPTGNSLSVAPSTIQGQGQPQGLVTLASNAPSGGALVTLASSNPSVAKVPPTVTVGAGARTATFLIDTASVGAPTALTITASYGGAAFSAPLTVTPPAVTAAFSVTSPSHGSNACAMTSGLTELDCLLDGSASTGPIDAWVWTYAAGTATLGHTSKDSGTKPQISTKCSFLNTASGGDDPNGDKYLKMEVTLQVQDRSGTRSGIVRQAVKLYPDRLCGFNY